MLDLYIRAMRASAHQGKLRNQEDKLVSLGRYRGVYILLGMSCLLTTE